MRNECKVLHVGQSNGRCLDAFGVDRLGEANEGMDLGVSIDEDLESFSSSRKRRWLNVTGFYDASVVELLVRTRSSFFRPVRRR